MNQDHRNITDQTPGLTMIYADRERKSTEAAARAQLEEEAAPTSKCKKYNEGDVWSGINNGWIDI